MDLSSFLGGAAVGIFGALAAGFLKKAGEDAYSWVKKKINPKSGEPAPSHLVVHVNSGNLLATSAVEAVAQHQHTVLERVSMISLEEINNSLFEAPPLQRDQIAKRYIGLRIEWETEFVDGELDDKGDIRLQLSIPDTTHESRSVWCIVPAGEYRELGILRERSKIRVSGEIYKVERHGVKLIDARLHIDGSHSNS